MRVARNINGGTLEYTAIGDSNFRVSVAQSSPVSPKNIMQLLSDEGLSLSGNEKLGFGKSAAAKQYNSYLDLSLFDTEVAGIPIFSGRVASGDILLTLWPTSKMLVPAKLTTDGLRMNLELATEVEAGQRAFVLTEEGDSLVAVTGACRNNTVKTFPKISLVSWLLACNSQTVLSTSKYSVIQAGKTFEITCNASGEKYIGQLAGKINEIQDITVAVVSNGIGAVLPYYGLRKV